MRVLVTGGTGFVGRSLLRELNEAIVVTRRAGSANEIGLAKTTQVVRWAEPTQSPLPISVDCGAQAVVHLIGESLAEGRWSADKKRRIRESRIATTKNLVRSLALLVPRPAVLVSASAMGFYGSRGEQDLDEAASSGTDFMAEICREWEEAAIAARELGIRVVLLRMGLVLGPGGFLAKVLPIFRRGLGGRLGNGRQWCSWIHVDDLAQLILRCCRDSKFSGPVNATTPFPVRNRELTRALAQAVGRPAVLPVPRFALRLAYGELADVMTASIRMKPVKVIAAGFHYKFPRIHEALADLVIQPNSGAEKSENSDRH